jgi:hypothetical protein
MFPIDLSNEAASEVRIPLIAMQILLIEFQEKIKCLVYQFFVMHD